MDIQISDNARNFLRNLKDKELLKKIDAAIVKLSDNPKTYPRKKLAGYSDMYRIKLPKNHRLTYIVNQDENYILIVKIGYRDKFYDDL